MSNISEFCILGERCSGTNYLQRLIELNFGLKITHRYGHKHFFGFSNYQNSDNVLFIGIVRDPFQWLESLNQKKHHFPWHLRKNIKQILTQPYYSIYDSREDHGVKFNTEILEDRNMYTRERYKNIIDLRNMKNKFLMEDMKNKVKNYILIKYEDLSTNTFDELEKIRSEFGLKKMNTEYVNFVKHTKKKGSRWDKSHKLYVPKPLTFNLVKNLIDIEQEHKLGYLKTFVLENKVAKN